MATKTLVTKFGHADEAEHAVYKLRQDGFDLSALGWVTRAEDGSEIAQGNLVDEEPVQHKGSALARTTIGCVLGGFAGMLIGITTITMAGIAGPLVLAAPLVFGLVGVVSGAAAGARIDQFAHVDEPPPLPSSRSQQAHRYAARLGGDAAVVLVTVSNVGEEARALEVLRGEASLHRHPLVFRVPALSDEGRPSKPSLA